MHRCIVVAAAVLTLASDPQAPEAARVLAEMRQALGVDAIANVKAFSLSGSFSRNLGEQTIQFDVEMICELPDKCLEELKLDSVKINPKIDPKRFDPAR